VLDGSLIDSIPLPASTAPPRRTLVLLTKPMRQRLLQPRQDALTYVGPSRPLEGAPWDYTRPDLIETFYRLGEEDGARHVSAQATGELEGDEGLAPSA
jgi:hypothetical protein